MVDSKVNHLNLNKIMFFLLLRCLENCFTPKKKYVNQQTQKKQNYSRDTFYFSQSEYLSKKISTSNASEEKREISFKK